MVKKPTPISPSFPWEQLKAESMRSICRDLGLKVAHNRAVMTHFLESVSKIGLPRALALDGEEEEKKSVLLTTPSSSSRKRTRAAANEDDNADAGQQSISTRSSSNKGQTTTPTRPRRGAMHEQAQEEEEGEGEGAGAGGAGEESSGQPSPSKRYRITVTSNYNTRFKADRRGRMSDPGPRGGRRRGRVSFAATTGVATPRGASRRGPAARARASGRGARMRTATLGAQQDRPAGRRVRLVEPGSSETADENDGDDGDDEGVGRSASAVVVVARRVPSVGEMKRRGAVAGLVNGVEEEQGPAKRARKGRRLPAVKRGGVVANGAPKLVFDGIDVPRLSKAVLEAIRKREMVLYDEDADGEVDETLGEAGQEGLIGEGAGQEGVVPESVDEEGAGEEGAGEEGAGEEGVAPESVGKEGVSEEGVAPESVGEEGVGEEGVVPESVGEEGTGEQGVVPDSVGEENASEEGVAPEDMGALEGAYEPMPVDKGDVDDESGADEEAQLEELIADDSSSLGNSNKENEAPEDDEMGEEQGMMEMEMDTIGVTTATIDQDISGLAAEALFGAGAIASTSVPVPSGSDIEGNDIMGEEDFLT